MIDLENDNSILKKILEIIVVGLVGYAAYSGYTAIDVKEQVKQLETEIEQYKSEYDSLLLEKGQLETKYTELNMKYSELQLDYDELMKEVEILKADNDNLVNLKNEEIVSEYNYIVENGIYKITANEIVDLYNSDMKKLKELDGQTIEITGKVKKYSFGETIKDGGQTIKISPCIVLDHDSMKSFTGIQCYGEDLTLNGIMVDYEDLLNTECTVRIKGKAKLGFTFNMEDCSLVVFLDDNGNVIDSWKTGELRTEFKNRGRDKKEEK